jgi:hypothetical protein
MDTLAGFIVEIDRDAVVHEDVHGIKWALGTAFDLTLRSGSLCLIEVMISGYDNDPRSLYEVPEVRRWMRKIAAGRMDYLFWLTPGTLWTTLLCLNPTMWSRLADNSLRIEFDPEAVFRQFALSSTAATTLLRSSGMKKSRVKAADDLAEQNLFAVFERRSLGDYVVLHPEERAVVTYRQEG